MRTIIEVPEPLIQDLDRLGRQRKLSRAAVIREAIRAYLDQNQLEAADAAFGIWAQKGSDGVDYQERLRSEWEESP